MDQGNFISFHEIIQTNCHESMDVMFRNWLCSNGTLDFLRIWELKNNTEFNVHGYTELFKSPKNITLNQWIEKTNAMSFVFPQGKEADIFVHPDIAFDFIMWANSKFRAEFIIDALPKETQTLLLEHYSNYGAYQSRLREKKNTEQRSSQTEKIKKIQSSKFPMMCHFIGAFVCCGNY